MNISLTVFLVISNTFGTTLQNFKMANLKLDFDEEMDEPYTLVAIHCSEEEYKLAYLLNVHLGTKFTRRGADLDYSNEGLLVTFPIYDYEDTNKYNCYHLVANRCKSEEASLQSAFGLFESGISKKSKIHYLLPEFKKTDYFLKIYSDFEAVPLRKIISGINEIKQVISAYVVEIDDIKSKNNLIFD